MLYIEYHTLSKEYKDADKHYDDVLEKKARIYFKPLLGASDPSKEIVGGGKRENPIEAFVEQIEQLDVDLQEARNIRDLKGYLLKKKEIELRESKEVNDRLYVMYYLDNMKVKHIAYKVSYTREWTYELINKLKESLNSQNNLQKLTKPML